MTDCIEVHTTLASQEAAHKIAEILVTKRLAACVQISGPITSVYWWQGKIEQAQEWVCTAKTQKHLYQHIEQAIQEVHSYTVPEILATEIVEGLESYKSWIAQETERHPVSKTNGERD